MSISDADTSTPLTTSWVEQTLVLFNAGTLSSISDCVTEVESKLRRGTISGSTTPTLTEVQRWLVRAKEELVEIRNYTFSRRYAYADTVAGTYRYALPPDFNGGRLSLRDITNERDLEVWTEFWFDAKYPNPSGESNDYPAAACIKGNELWLIPPPSGVFRLQIEYNRSGADNTPTDLYWIPEPDRWKICDYAVAQSFESLHMFQEADRYMQRWYDGIKKSQRADSKRKWKRMEYQAVSCFQVSKARGYQNRLDN